MPAAAAKELANTYLRDPRVTQFHYNNEGLSVLRDYYFDERRFMIQCFFKSVALVPTYYDDHAVPQGRFEICFITCDIYARLIQQDDKLSVLLMLSSNGSRRMT